MSEKHGSFSITTRHSLTMTSHQIDLMSILKERGGKEKKDKHDLGGVGVTAGADTYS